MAQRPLALECRVFDVLHFGTHDVFMADIVNVSVREELLDEKGKICIERAGLMAYAHGEYYSLGKKIGKFGFSAVKRKKAPAKQKPAPVAKNKNKKPDAKSFAGKKRSSAGKGKK